MRRFWWNNPLKLVLALPVLAFGAAGTGGCAYHFQNSANPLAETRGIRRVYLAAVENNTFKPGVENLLYNSIQQTLAARGKLILVDRPELADGLLQASVQSAQSSTNATTPADLLQPVGVGPSINTASEYLATLTCSFRLTKRDPQPGEKELVWAGGFTRNRPFQAQNRIGILGVTSPLINESELDRILVDLARRVSEDMHESMTGMF